MPPATRPPSAPISSSRIITTPKRSSTRWRGLRTGKTITRISRLATTRPGSAIPRTPSADCRRTTSSARPKSINCYPGSPDPAPPQERLQPRITQGSRPGAAPTGSEWEGTDRSARRPVHLPSAHQVQVDVKNGLLAMLPAVEKQPIAVFRDPLFLRHGLPRQNEAPQKGRMFWTRFVDRRDMSLGNDQNMGGRLR